MSVEALAGATACAGFVLAMLHVAATDLRSCRIGNRPLVLLAAGYLPLALAAGVPWAGMAAALVAALAVFAAGVACFAAGWMGGGDVKLASVATLWLGAAQAVPFLLIGSILGALLTAALIAAGRYGQGSAPRGDGSIAALPQGGSRREVAYGPALAAAAVLLLPGSPWAVAL